MPRTLQTMLAVLVLAASAGRAAEQSQKDYQVLLERPGKAGTTYDFAAAGATRRQYTIMANGQPAGTREHVAGVEIQAKVEILEVDEKGRDLKHAYTIERCIQIVNGREMPLLPKGAVLIAEAGKKDTTYTLKNGDLTPEQIEMLRILIILPDLGSATMDELFGTKQRQKIGSSWPANAEAVARDAAGHDLIVDAANIAGTMKLVAVREENGVEVMELEKNLKITGFKSKAAEADGAEFKESSAVREVSLHIPVDPGLSDIRFTTNQTTTVQMHNAAQPGAVIHVTVNRLSNVRVTRLDK